MKIFNYAIILCIIILGITFSILNAEPVVLHYYVGNRQLPLSLLLVCGFVLGLMCGMLIMSIKLMRAKAKTRSIRKKLKLAEQEVVNLRVIPVQDNH